MTPLEKAARAVRHTTITMCAPEEIDIARAVLMAARDSVEDERRSPVGNAIWRARINTILSES